MEYRNVKTGIVISTDSVISGNNWEPVKAEKKEGAPAKETKKRTKKNG